MARPIKKTVVKQVVKEENKEILPINYKTEMCTRYERFGKCTFIGCTFAHG